MENENNIFKQSTVASFNHGTSVQHCQLLWYLPQRLVIPLSIKVITFILKGNTSTSSKHVPDLTILAVLAFCSAAFSYCCFLQFLFLF